jgi:hypothetical protein
VVSLDSLGRYARCFCYETIGRFVAGGDNGCHHTGRRHSDLSPARSVSSTLVCGSRHLARHFSQHGLLDAISTQVRLARGRAGTFEVIDFVAILLGYAASGEATLEAFFDRLAPFAQPFMALFGRENLAHRSTFSRFLADVDAPCLEALRHLFQQDLHQHGFRGEQLGGFIDRHGHRLVVFDVDGTRQAARQRALATSADLPVHHRRMDLVCAPGYTGRQRGEVVRTRTTVLQAHT